MQKYEMTTSSFRFGNIRFRDHDPRTIVVFLFVVSPSVPICESRRDDNLSLSRQSVPQTSSLSYNEFVLIALCARRW